MKKLLLFSICMLSNIALFSAGHPLNEDVARRALIKRTGIEALGTVLEDDADTLTYMAAINAALSWELLEAVSDKKLDTIAAWFNLDQFKTVMRRAITAQQDKQRYPTNHQEFVVSDEELAAIIDFERLSTFLGYKTDVPPILDKAKVITSMRQFFTDFAVNMQLIQEAININATLAFLQNNSKHAAAHKLIANKDGVITLFNKLQHNQPITDAEIIAAFNLDQIVPQHIIGGKYLVRYMQLNRLVGLIRKAVETGGTISFIDILGTLDRQQAGTYIDIQKLTEAAEIVGLGNAPQGRLETTHRGEVAHNRFDHPMIRAHKELLVGFVLTLGFYMTAYTLWHSIISVDLVPHNHHITAQLILIACIVCDALTWIFNNPDEVFLANTAINVGFMNALQRLDRLLGTPEVLAPNKRINQQAVDRARELITQGQYCADITPCTVTYDQKRQYAQEVDPDTYSSYFLTTNEHIEAQHIDHYELPWGNLRDNRIYRSALVAAELSAQLEGFDEIREAISELLRLMETQEIEKELIAVQAQAATA